MKAPLIDCLWAFCGALSLIAMGLLGALLQIFVDLEPIVLFWKRYPYWVGNILIFIMIICSILRYHYKNARDSKPDAKECGIDYILSFSTRIFIGVLGGGIYSILVAILYNR